MLNEYPDVLTPHQVKEILQIGRDSTYALLASQKIKTVKIGKTYRIPKSALLQFLEMPTYNTNTDVG